MPVNPHNIFYDTLTPGRGGLAWLGGDPTSPLARALGGSIPPPPPPQVAAAGGGGWAPSILRQAGTRLGGAEAAAQAAALSSETIPPSLAGSSLDILRPMGAKGPGGRFIPRGSIGTGMIGPGGAPPGSVGLPSLPGAAVQGADDLAGALGGAAKGAPKAGMFARFAPNIASSADAMKGLSAGARARVLLGAGEGAGKWAMAKSAFGKSMPALAGLQFRPMAEGLGDSLAGELGVDDSGMVGDFLGGATLGAGVGGTAGMLGGPFAPFTVAGGALAGAIGGGIGGLIGGDRDDAKKGQEAEYQQSVDALHQQLGQFGDAVDAGYITGEEHQAASKAYNDLIRDGAAVEDAYAQAFGPLEQSIMAQQEYEMSPEGQLMAQMEAARAEEQANMMEAQRYAAQMQAPMIQQQQQIYQDLAAVRDSRLQDPNLPADMQAIMNASTPNIDIANLQAIAAAGNPLTILNQQQYGNQQPTMPLTDQLMRMYELQMQYGGQGGGGGDDLASLIQAGALAAPTE